MRAAPAFGRATLRVGILSGAASLLGACVSDPDRPDVVASDGCRTETRRDFQTAGPKAAGTWVTRRAGACHPAGASREPASPTR